jgi:predicted ATPase
MGRTMVSPVFVGRDAELAALTAALDAAVAGEPAVVLVSGEAGVGKTRLV